MIVIQLQFLAGRYHATPWGRHVNEGVPEWPPSPFRIARALITTAKRRFPRLGDEVLQQLLEPFATEVRYALPQVSSSHIRHYLHENSKAKDKYFSKQKIFDAFISLPPEEKLYVILNATLREEQRELLKQLLNALPYLGRSESWVRTDLLDDLPAGIEPNCIPLQEREQFESVRLATILDSSSYESQSQKIATGKGKTTRPLSWLEALAVGTDTLLKTHGKKGAYSGHPLLHYTNYTLPPLDRTITPQPPPALDKTYHYAKFALTSTVLPLIIESVKIAERSRVKLMGISKRVEGSGDRVSQTFSGKNHDGTPLPGHKHAYILPLDEDRDGRIDHLLIFSREGFTPNDLIVLNRFTSLWQSKGRPDVHVVLVDLGTTLSTCATTWVSASPMIIMRHWRKGRGPFNSWLTREVEKECERHGLPTPQIVDQTEHSLGAHPYHWVEFTRSRKGHVPQKGYGFELQFAEEIRGPFSLGSLAHFGLGLFVPKG